MSPCSHSGTWTKLLTPSASERLRLLRWQKLPEFQTAYRDARRAAHGQSVARLQQASGAAVSTLLKVMLDANTPASTKVRAADSVLNHSAKAIELEDIEVRVDQLERAAEASRVARQSEM